MTANRLCEVLSQLRSEIKEISPNETHKMINKEKIYLIDIREESELINGIIETAFTPGRSNLENWSLNVIKQMDSPIIIYCSGGTRSLFAANSLITLGYTNVRSMVGGLNAWKSNGLPIVESEHLNINERLRYARNILLPEIGIEGQLKLKRSRVLIIGVGGLGASCAYYLAAAGVGTLGIVDHDKIDISNLQRQILYSSQDIGTPKSSTAKKVLENFNPEIKINEYNESLTQENSINIFSKYQIIVDCSDNFKTRYLTNDMSLELGIPLVHGSIYRYTGQVSVFNINNGVCYRCVYRDPPPPELAPSCSDAGVLGILSGIIGIMQATEVIKIILNIGEVQSSNLLQFDGLKSVLKKIKTTKRKNCLCNKYYST